MNLSAEFFFDLERRLKDAGLDSDSEKFDVIKERLSRKEPLNADEFARQAIYVILAGGFSQKTAKVIHAKVMNYLQNCDAGKFPSCGGVPSISEAGWFADSLCSDTLCKTTPALRATPPQEGNSPSVFDDLIKIFNNKNKINAAIKIWQNRQKYRDDYYEIECHSGAAPKARNPESGGASVCDRVPDNFAAQNFRDDILEQKLTYLSGLPHIGKITANHLARNLGEDVVKYDIWIQRLGCVFSLQKQVTERLNKFAERRAESEVKLEVNSSELSSLLSSNLQVSTSSLFALRSANLYKKINNGKLDPDIKAACDEMFAHLTRETGLPRGYIDVVLWKACQTGFIKL
jgi:hypothetical protein